MFIITSAEQYLKMAEIQHFQVPLLIMYITTWYYYLKYNAGTVAFILYKAFATKTCKNALTDFATSVCPSTHR